MFIKWLEKCIYKVTNTKSRAYKTLSINEVRHHCAFFISYYCFFSVDIQEQSSAKKGESEKNYEALQKM